MKWFHLMNKADGEIADIYAHNMIEAVCKCELLLDWPEEDIIERI